MKTPDVDQLLRIGIALSAEKDDYRLLTTILTAAMDITQCDGGTLYTVQDNSLVFRVMITRSSGTSKGTGGESIDMPPVPITSQAHVSSRTAATRALINIPDVYGDDRFDFSGTRRYDEMTGYKTTSLLCVPMENDQGDVIGVLQLINAMDENGATIPFDPSVERVILSLSSQAAICLTKMNYANEITNLFNSFVRVMSTAIDARSPYNANHTRNMVKYGERFIEWLENSGNPWRFSSDEREEFLMSIWLHDVGKLITPRTVMDKETRLGIATEKVSQRFERIALILKINLLEGRSSEQQYKTDCGVLADARALVERANKAPYVTDEMLLELETLGGRRYKDEEGNMCPYLTPEELESLMVRKGTLTEAERVIMREHVEMTERMLGEMTFSSKFERVPKWTSMHHEFVNGKGYPKNLSGRDIPQEVRLLTILDIFDALTARDRPYKKPMPSEKAFAILEEMARDGDVDSDILSLFRQSDAYREDI